MPAYAKILIALFLAFTVPVFTFIGCGTSYYNTEVSLRNAHEANEDANRVVYNKFVNILQEKAGVMNASVDAQKELFETIMNSKSGQGGGALVKFIHEHNPNPDAALTETSRQFTMIMNEISGLREEFARIQKKSLQIEKDHKDLVNGFFSGKMLFVFGGDRTPLETNIVTGTETEEAFSSPGAAKAVNTRELFNRKTE